MLYAIIDWTLVAIASSGATARLAASWHRLPLGPACDCAVFPERHTNSLLLFITGAAFAADSFWVMQGDNPSKIYGAAAMGILGGMYLRDWWKHTRNSRKKLKDRVLGVVRETAAGLKIVPEPAGAPA